ncbi:hypothetical protein ILUMI_19308 [Ignelater luminosus]|uniref:Uncharacterized protein n=1 Tax=Ignelater luminosus TaxID=2038154 RepID=A0A8K0CGI4_IGNLU|nr:hypothetical protein ILUMI_19308 [Ignelater luminosus]
MLVKLYASMKTRKDLLQVINKMEKFWAVDKYDDDLKMDIQQVYGNVKKSAKLMLIILFVGVSVYLKQAIFARKFVYSAYHPTDRNKSPDYELMFSFQVYFAIIACVFMLGSDGLFLALITNISCELKVVKNRFANIPIIRNKDEKYNTNDSLRTLFQVVDHHNLILE